MEENSISKSESKDVVNDKKSFNQLKGSNRIPYHRTSGARFCPNGNILGEQRNDFLNFLIRPICYINFQLVIQNIKNNTHLIFSPNVVTFGHQSSIINHHHARRTSKPETDNNTPVKGNYVT